VRGQPNGVGPKTEMVQIKKWRKLLRGISAKMFRIQTDIKQGLPVCKNDNVD